MEKKVFNLIVVDESGSMSIIRKQAFEGLNETLETVKKMQEAHPELEQRITLMTFDSDHKTFLYDNKSGREAEKLAWNQYNPGGATPLYDAIGLGISKINAIAGKDDEVLVTVITDGEENCSVEYSLQMIKNLIEKLKEQNWTFTLIGTDNLDVESMARSMSIDDHLTFAEDAVGTQEMFAKEREARMCWNAEVAMDACCAPEEVAERKKARRGGFFKR